MNALLARDVFDHATLVDPRTIAVPAPAERVFDLHPALHIGTFVSFFAYLGIMWASFGNPELAIPFVIFAVFLAGAFITPAMWVRVAQVPGAKARLAEFLARDFQCETGAISGKAAAAQVMIMPAMLILWGLIAAAIHASV